jgi:hypothetical protein
LPRHKDPKVFSKEFVSSRLGGKRILVFHEKSMELKSLLQFFRYDSWEEPGLLQSRLILELGFWFLKNTDPRVLQEL